MKHCQIRLASLWKFWSLISTFWEDRIAAIAVACKAIPFEVRGLESLSSHKLNKNIKHMKQLKRKR